jgi:two-component system, OmpR family, phosphate regulon sensor histidine kinase PhoR
MSVAGQLRLALGTLIALLLGILVVAFYVPYELNSSANSKYVEDVIPLRSLVDDLVLQMTRQEAAVQAYVVTGDIGERQRFLDGQTKVNRDLAMMKPYDLRHPSLAPLLRLATVQISDLRGLFERQVAAVDRGKGRGTARSQIANIKRKSGRFRATAQLMLSETQRFTEDAKREQQSMYRRLLLVLGSLGLLAIALGGVLLTVTPRRLGQLYESEERSRREAESRADAARALEHVSDGVILTDLDGRIRFWNPAAAQLTDLERVRALGQSLRDLLPALEAITPAGGGLEGAGAAVVPLQLAHRERWLSITSVDFGEGRVYALRDVTEERLLETMRSEFVATASHELRTPMTGIYGAARTLLRLGDELEPARRRAFLEMIVTESERLSRIVDDILLANRIDAGSVEIATEHCDARELADSVLTATEVGAPSSISFSLDSPSELSPVACDPDRLRQVLVNLVDNAIKYSPEGGEVRVELAEEDGKMRFAVRDEGLGFPQSEQERIFERFHRLDPHLSRGIGGTGLGLYISRELVERMHGRIWAQSEPGQGSTFYIELPLADSTAKADLSG